MSQSERIIHVDASGEAEVIEPSDQAAARRIGGPVLTLGNKRYYSDGPDRVLDVERNEWTTSPDGSPVQIKIDPSASQTPPQTQK